MPALVRLPTAFTLISNCLAAGIVVDGSQNHEFVHDPSLLGHQLGKLNPGNAGLNGAQRSSVFRRQYIRIGV